MFWPIFDVCVKFLVFIVLLNFVDEFFQFIFLFNVFNTFVKLSVVVNLFYKLKLKLLYLLLWFWLLLFVFLLDKILCLLNCNFWLLLLFCNKYCCLSLDFAVDDIIYIFIILTILLFITYIYFYIYYKEINKNLLTY
jgi:hypothetical protein